MPSFFRIILPLISVLGMSTAVFAMGSSAPADYVPDPALKKASIQQLQSKVANACIVIQNRKNNRDINKELRGKCGCYAKTTLKSLSAEELQSYRDTGIFNRSARRKALNALESCGLERP